MILSSTLCFSLTGFLLYTGTIQAQLLPEREDSLQGPVKSVQIEQAILVRNLDQWAAGEGRKLTRRPMINTGARPNNLSRR